MLLDEVWYDDGTAVIVIALMRKVADDWRLAWRWPLLHFDVHPTCRSSLNFLVLASLLGRGKNSWGWLASFRCINYQLVILREIHLVACTWQGGPESAQGVWTHVLSHLNDLIVFSLLAFEALERLKWHYFATLRPIFQIKIMNG